MRAVDIITKKRDGGVLSEEELDFFVQGFTDGSIPDYQAAAFTMAVLIRGMNADETTNLTMAMINTGDQLDLSDVVDVAVDKHSTGGVGDKTTLVIAPLVAACGVPVGKMSGRGLSFTGGTLDKMESFPGYRVDLSIAQFKQQLQQIGIVLAGQTAELAPADGKFYALRDVTGTVPSIPLIASSIMSKKLAAGTTAIVLDVKVGVGAFMQDLAQAEELSRMMLSIAKRSGRKAVALISDMNQPLGNAVGHVLEVREAIDTLAGRGPRDFVDHCIEVAGHMLLLAEKTKTLADGMQAAQAAINSGAALQKFRELVIAQGGDASYIDHPEKFPAAAVVLNVAAASAGWIESIHAREVGLTAVGLGAGREKKGDPIDFTVGIIIKHKVGDRIAQGDELFSVHAANQQSAEMACERLVAAHHIVAQKVEPLPLFYRTLTQE